MTGLGTILNLSTVAAGGFVGLWLGHRLPERIRATVMQAIGLTVIAVAVVGLEPLFDADRGLRRAVILVGAMTLGAIVGEAAGLERRLEHVGLRLQERFSTGASGARFAEGFVVASTVFCAGPLTLLGAVEDGLGQGIRLLAIKSTLDGITVIGFAAIYGWGAVASLVTIAVFQGGATALAAVVEPVLTVEILAQLGAIGSLLVLGIGFRLLDISQIRVVNMMPALVLGPVAAGIVEAIV